MPYPCPVCHGEVRELSRLMVNDSAVGEFHERCENGCYEVYYAYGATDTRIGRCEWREHYTDPEDYRESFREAMAKWIEVERVMIEANSPAGG